MATVSIAQPAPLAREDNLTASALGARAPETRHVHAGSLTVLVLALLLIAASLAQTIYRLSLPWDGWSYTRDLSGAGQRLVFNESIAALPSNLQRGDVLLAVQGQPFESLLADALSVQPKRPINWQVGNYATYTVLRAQNGGARELTVLVPLVRLPPLQTLLNIGQTLLTNPTILPSFLIGLFVFLRRPSDYAARLLFLLTACFLTSEGISQAVTHSNVLGPSELFDGVAFWGAQFFNALIWPLLIAPVYINLFWRFPIAKRPLREHPRLTLILLYG
ncbi:MAG: hypothetical protein LC737_08825, partial [Chloroflexi bacterium]|nr:hypothetical protein [Chloroflexota bacterium]